MHQLSHRPEYRVGERNHEGMGRCFALACELKKFEV